MRCPVCWQHALACISIKKISSNIWPCLHTLPLKFAGYSFAGHVRAQALSDEEPDLVSALGVDIYRGQETCLSGVGVDPPHRVQTPAVLSLKDLLLSQGLHCVACALLFWHYQSCDAEQAPLGVKLASQNPAALYTPAGVGPCIPASGARHQGLQVVEPV